MEKGDLPATSSSRDLRLSKSKFLSGLQCLKRLYLDVHQPELATPPDARTRSLLDIGTQVGEFARRRFPGGRFVAPGFRYRDAVEETARLLGVPSVPAIFEGTFHHDGVVVRVDILEQVAEVDEQPAGWRLIEVKASTRVKDIHLDDLAVQSHVLLGAGVPLLEVALMHLNTEYVYTGDPIDLERLFMIVDLTTAVADRRAGIDNKIATMKSALLQRDPPHIEPGAQCDTPYECPFWGHCTKNKPARWIYYLPGGNETIVALAEQGIQTIDEMPDSASLSAVQRRVKENVEWISPRLADVLRCVEYPVHHMDFETVMLPVPKFPSTRPYQPVPFQWSNHIEAESGTIIHREYFHEDGEDPRKRWAESLIEALGDRGSICVYSSYERAILLQVMQSFPEYQAALAGIISRLWDLLPVIRDHYYHPGFQGSYSMKAVLPALIPSLGYADLSIKDGSQAAGAFYRMAFVERDWIEQMSLREALRRYCARDTIAMVELRRVLAEKAGITHPSTL
ncbi:MAG TPA: DUF2779 domain-containing protein [Nitrospira sp.]|nr:DUF2779 domain-containing protein [Nitrospira sp.]